MFINEVPRGTTAANKLFERIFGDWRFLESFGVLEMGSVNGIHGVNSKPFSSALVATCGLVTLRLIARIRCLRVLFTRIRSSRMNDILTPRELEYLLIAHDYVNNPINANRRFPDSTHFQTIMGIGKSGVSNLKRNLLDKGCLEHNEGGEVRLSSEVEDYLDDRRNDREIQVSYIPIPGDVSAGMLVNGELAVYAQDVGDDIRKSIPIPHSDPQSKVVAYRVVGDSMENEHIYEDDYVLVEVNPNAAYQENRLVVARYLLLDENLERHPLRGPTLKAYKGEVVEPSGRKYHLLGWKRNYGKPNPHEIQASYFLPVGIVIGIFRLVKY